MYAKNLPSKKVVDKHSSNTVPLSLPNPNYSPTLKFSDSEIVHEFPNLDILLGDWTFTISSPNQNLQVWSFQKFNSNFHHLRRFFLNLLN